MEARIRIRQVIFEMHTHIHEPHNCGWAPDNNNNMDYTLLWMFRQTKETEKRKRNQPPATIEPLFRTFYNINNISRTADYRLPILWSIALLFSTNMSPFIINALVNIIHVIAWAMLYVISTYEYTISQSDTKPHNTLWMLIFGMKWNENCDRRMRECRTNPTCICKTHIKFVSLAGWH